MGEPLSRHRPCQIRIPPRVEGLRLNWGSKYEGRSSADEEHGVSIVPAGRRARNKSERTKNGRRESRPEQLRAVP